MAPRPCSNIAPGARPRRNLLSVFTTVFVLLMPTASGAITTNQIIDGTVDALVAAGPATGIPLGSTEGALVKSIAKCLTAGKPDIVGCARTLALDKVPDEIKPLATCLLTSGDAIACGKDAVIRRLPEETRTMAQCVLDTGRPACVSNAAIDRLPARAQPLARCLADGRLVATCATESGYQLLSEQAKAAASCVASGPNLAACAGNPSLGAAADVVGVAANLGLTVPTLGGGTSPIENLMCGIQAIAAEKWDRVSTCLGASGVKIGMNVMLASFAPIIPADVRERLVNATVDKRLNDAVELYEAIKAGDIATIVRLAVQNELVAQFVPLCAVIPPGAVHEATCGTLGKLIGIAGKLTQEAAGAVVDAAAAGLDAIGGVMIDGVNLVRKRLAGKRDNCLSPAAYYAEQMSACLAPGVTHRIMNTETAGRFATERFEKCVSYFNGCEISDRPTELCTPLAELFQRQSATLFDALQQSAAAYARSRKRQFSEARGRICTPGSGTSDGMALAAPACQAALEANYPQPASSCPTHYAPPTVHGPQHHACQTAVRDEIDRLRPELCDGAGTCFPIGPDAMKSADLKSPLKAFRLPLAGERTEINWSVINSSTGCPDPLIGGSGACTCPYETEAIKGVSGRIACCLTPCTPGSFRSNGTCRPKIDASAPIVSQLPTQPLVPCSHGMVHGQDGNCACPLTTRWDGRQCRPATVTAFSCEAAGMVTAANGECQCRAPTVWTGTRCEARFAPGWSPTQPIREALGTLPPMSGGGTRVVAPALGPALAPTLSFGASEKSQRCRAPLPVGQWPNCCPLGTMAANGRCLRLANPDPVVVPRHPPLVGGGILPVPRQVCPAHRPNGTYPHCCAVGQILQPGGGCRDRIVRLRPPPAKPPFVPPSRPVIAAPKPSVPPTKPDTGTVDFGVCPGCGQPPRGPKVN